MTVAILQLLQILRPVFFWGAALLALVALVDWLVRTRRVSPFSALARFMRGTIDRLFRPIEARIVRAGGNPQHTPWWALVFTVVCGILVLELLGFLAGQAALLQYAGSRGAAGIGQLLLRWSFGILRLALIVRVISSWVQVSPWSRWVRWAFILTEPLLRPVRQLLPTIGMIDISPLVVWLLLGLIQAFLLRTYGV